MGRFPYLLEPGVGQQVLEYPVLTGVFMYVAAWVTRLLDGDSQVFFAVNVVGMSALLAWTIASTVADGAPAALGRADGRPGPGGRAGRLRELGPAGDRTDVGVRWPRGPGGHPAVAGMWLGLAVAAKFYPLVLIGPIALLCVRRGRWRALGVFLAAALGSWLVVNVPVMMANFEGWSRFYTFSRERGMDFGSPWYALSTDRRRPAGRGVELAGVRLVPGGVRGDRLAGPAGARSPPGWPPWPSSPWARSS